MLWMSHPKESEAPYGTLRSHHHPAEQSQECNFHNVHDKDHLLDGSRTLGKVEYRGENEERGMLGPLRSTLRQTLNELGGESSG